MDPTFSAIASSYDFMTRMLSMGQERRWKERAVGLIPRHGGRTRVLDLASGTGDFALHLRKAGFRAPIIGLERNPQMIALSRRKLQRLDTASFIRGDLLQIPFKDRSFDVVTLGYALRYVQDIRWTLAEIHRLLRAGGMFVCLEFGIPKSHFYRRLCFGYLFLLGTFWGWALHGKPDTYWHIVESLKAYPGQELIKAWTEEAGFRDVELHEQLGGIAVILSGIRQ